MNTNDLNTALYEKMSAEQDKYRDWLKSQSPAEVLNHAYEYTVREDIVMAMEQLELTDAQAQALLDSPTPLADVYRHFEKLETDHMDVIRDSIENRADDVCRSNERQTGTVLVVEPGKKPYTKDIFFSLESLQKEVGGDIQAVYPFQEPVALICDEEGKLKGKPLNRALRDEEGQIYDVLAGTFLVVGLGESSFSALEPSLIEKFSEHFIKPELFAQINGKLAVTTMQESSDIFTRQPQFDSVPIYSHTASYAREHNELSAYRASLNANIKCKEAIESAVREHFDGMYLSHDAAKGVIETYGMDRVMLVLANTVQLQDWDGRYSPRNKEWAKTIPNYNSDTVRCGYALNSHPAVLNGFIDLVREEHLRRQPLTAEDIQAEAERILRELRAPDVPNSPHGTHYMARISPEFLNRAGSKDHDRLMNLLPFRSLAFTGMKGLPGTYATILASEDRSKELRQPRFSVREHLKQEPKQAAPKAPAHKKREPER